MFWLEEILQQRVSNFMAQENHLRTLLKNRDLRDPPLRILILEVHVPFSRVFQKQVSQVSLIQLSHTHMEHPHPLVSYLIQGCPGAGSFMASGSEHSCQGLVSGFVGTKAYAVPGPALRRKNKQTNLTFVNFAKAFDPGSLWPGHRPGLGAGGELRI